MTSPGVVFTVCGILHSTFTAVQLVLERVRNSGSQVGMHEQFWHNSKCGARFLCFGVADKVARFIAWAYDWGANSGDLLAIFTICGVVPT